MFKPRKFQEALPVEYTPSELAALADQADELVSEMERLEQLKAALPKKIESIKEQVYDVSKKRKAGFRDKLVDCETVADANLPEVITIRLDTGEEIGRRAMTESERQEDLFPEQAEETKGQSEEERERLHKEAVAKWRREPVQATAEPHPEIEARAEDDSEWNELLDQAEAELEAEEAAKPNWQTRALDYDDYLAYALSTGIKNPQSHAQKWHLTGEHESDVRQFLRRQAEQESEPDNFTADKCMECQSIDGAHAIDCTFHPEFALNITPKKTRKGNSIQPRSHA